MDSSTLVKAAATVYAVAVMASSGALLARKSFTVATDLKEYLCGLARDALREETTLQMDEFVEGEPNMLFQEAMLYMSPKIHFPDHNTLHLFKYDGDSHLQVSLGEGEVFTDSFDGVKLRWTFRHRRIESDEGFTVVHSYDLTFPMEALRMVVNSYMPFVSREATSTRHM